MFASEGFRTLTFAMKHLDSPDIDGVLTQEDIESCYTLLGASCVEDLLQHDVSRCLRDFKRAGIQTWMLTGDKGKTAKMIGQQCGMFSATELKRDICKSNPEDLGEEILESIAPEVPRFVKSGTGSPYSPKVSVIYPR